MAREASGRPNFGSAISLTEEDVFFFRVLCSYLLYFDTASDVLRSILGVLICSDSVFRRFGASLCRAGPLLTGYFRVEMVAGTGDTVRRIPILFDFAAVRGPRVGMGWGVYSSTVLG